MRGKSSKGQTLIKNGLSLKLHLSLVLFNTEIERTETKGESGKKVLTFELIVLQNPERKYFSLFSFAVHKLQQYLQVTLCFFGIAFVYIKGFGIVIQVFSEDPEVVKRQVESRYKKVQKAVGSYLRQAIWGIVKQVAKKDQKKSGTVHKSIQKLAEIVKKYRLFRGKIPKSSAKSGIGSKESADESTRKAVFSSKKKHPR